METKTRNPLVAHNCMYSKYELNCYENKYMNEHKNFDIF